MATRIDLSLEQKVNLIKKNEQGISFRQLKDKFHVSVGSISNILKRGWGEGASFTPVNNN